MPEKHLSLVEKVHSSYKQLAATAKSLNETFEEFGKTVEEIDYALKTSNLGMYLGGPVWIQIDGQDDGQTSYWRRELGYDRIDNRWGITVRTRSGSDLNSGHNNSDVWFFTDAPRRLQVEAAEKLPELLETLMKESDAIAQRIKGKLSAPAGPAAPTTRSSDKSETVCTVCLAS